MSSKTQSYTIDWGHLIFLVIIGGGVVWYLADAMSVSMDIHNLLLIGPLSAFAIVLCIVILPQCFQNNAVPQKTNLKSSEPLPMAILGSSELQTTDVKSLLLIGSVAAALGAYVFLLDVIGFDIATWLFALVVMFICGERRVLPLIIYPFLVSLLLISAFRALLPYPMFTAIL